MTPQNVQARSVVQTTGLSIYIAVVVVTTVVVIIIIVLYSIDTTILYTTAVPLYYLYVCVGFKLHTRNLGFVCRTGANYFDGVQSTTRLDVRPSRDNKYSIVQ